MTPTAVSVLLQECDRLAFSLSSWINPGILAGQAVQHKAARMPGRVANLGLQVDRRLAVRVCGDLDVVCTVGAGLLLGEDDLGTLKVVAAAVSGEFVQV
jgi:hypothetical protein